MKTGRNEPCPCASGLKFKKCCVDKAKILEPIFLEARNKMKAAAIKNIERKLKFGEVRPIIHSKFQNQNIIAVGNAALGSQSWVTMIDFLYDYLKIVFGTEWWTRETQKPENEQHTVLLWAKKMYDHQEKSRKWDEAQQLFSVEPNGPMHAYLTLAYDLYILKDHQKLHSKILKRLRNKDQFVGVRYELYVAATMIRAGYEIEHEDETDGTKKHPEFVAIHKVTKEKVLVEAKKRQRDVKLTVEEANSENIKLGVTGLIRKAFEKNKGERFIIFVDLDLPGIEGDPFKKPWTKQLLNSPSEAGSEDEHGRNSFNLLVFTNHPVETEDNKFPINSYVCVAPNNTKVFMAQDLVREIVQAVDQFGKIPNYFGQ